MTMTHTITFTHIQQYLIHNKSVLSSDFGVKQIGIFGSFIHETQTFSNDIDLLVEFKKGKESFRNYMNLKFYLEDEFGRKVDLIIKETLKAAIRDQVLEEVVYA